MDDDVADTEPQRAHLRSGTATRRTERLPVYGRFMYNTMDPRPRSGVPARTVRRAPRSRARPRRAGPRGCAPRAPAHGLRMQPASWGHT
jgi:hypothetical protein